MNQIADPRAHGAAAYRQRRTPRQGEAAVFAEASRRLRAGGSGMERTRALADNRRLWVMVLDLVSEPANELPLTLRGQIASLAHAVLRECDAAEPDVGFVLEMNEQIAGGLWS
jgi:flagellar biosynthesis regulator FlaF